MEVLTKVYQECVLYSPFEELHGLILSCFLLKNCFFLTCVSGLTLTGAIPKPIWHDPRQCTTPCAMQIWGLSLPTSTTISGSSWLHSTTFHKLWNCCGTIMTPAGNSKAAASHYHNVPSLALEGHYSSRFCSSVVLSVAFWGSDWVGESLVCHHFVCVFLL